MVLILLYCRYTCGAYASFYVPQEDNSVVTYKTETVTCQWNKTWSRDTLDECLWTKCIFIPEPPAEANMLYVPDGDLQLALLTGKLYCTLPLNVQMRHSSTIEQKIPLAIYNFRHC